MAVKTLTPRLVFSFRGSLRSKQGPAWRICCGHKPGLRWKIMAGAGLWPPGLAWRFWPPDA
ncbi:MAG: hypothetical protein U5K27_02250 [Desulfotignum sp.]|nr:hypothetical protein [Desulfotignum sp.]